MVGITARYNGADPHLLKISIALLSGVDSRLLRVVNERVSNGPSDDFLTSLCIVADGSLVFSSSASFFVLTQPTYNYQTRAITFNSTGENGLTVMYYAPGISHLSATSNTGIVDQ